MLRPPSATSGHLETSSGGKFDFIDQQDKPVSGSEPIHNVFDQLAKDHAEVAEAWTRNESLTTEAAADLQGDTITSTVPPPNDLHDTSLYSGDRSVIFVGTRSY
jgi:hypothetical protein